MTDDARKSRTAFFWVGLIVPLAVFAVAAGVIASWWAELPDPIAIHWGTNGVDGFASKAAFIPTTLGIGAAVIIFCAVLAILAPRLPASSSAVPVSPWSATARFMAAINLGLALMIGFLAVASAGIQRGLADAAAAPDITGAAFLGSALLVVGTVIGWFIQPKSPRSAAASASPVAATPLASGERAAWFATVTMTGAGLIVLAVAVASVVVMAAVFFLQGETAGGWTLLATSVGLVALVSTTVVFRIRISAEGLQVRSLIGWPNTRIPLTDITKVAVAQINPFAEFGGWGWRIGFDGRRGVVMRAGEALQVTQRDGRIFVVTVDGADRAAAVLEGLRNRGSEGQP